MHFPLTFSTSNQSQPFSTKSVKKKMTTLTFQTTPSPPPPSLQFQPSSSSTTNPMTIHRLLPLRHLPRRRTPSLTVVRCFSSDHVGQKVENKPTICTADELHYVAVDNSNWRLALWRYLPTSQGCKRNHPLLLLSGVGTNAIGYDLAPESSFARYMSGQGYDTWILEVRGAGLSIQGTKRQDIEHSAQVMGAHMEATAEKATKSLDNDDNLSHLKDSSSIDYYVESELVVKVSEIFMLLSERLSGFLSEGQSRIMSAKLFDQLQKLLDDSRLIENFNEIRDKYLNVLESNQNSTIGGQIRELSQRLVNIFEEGQRSVSPQIFDLQGRVVTTIEDFQKQLELIVLYDWDFDHYLEEDVPAVMEYIRSQCKPKDDKLLAIGHSMGGILLYAMLSRCAYEGKDPRVSAVVTLASSLDYTTSKSTLKMLLPLANPAQVLNVPVVPLGAMLSAAYPLSSSPPYVLSWLNNLISAEDMMHPELLKKLVLNNFCTIPAKLLLQLTTAFREGGLRDRSGTFLYKDHLHKSRVPVLALAADRDLICPPEAVYETVKSLPDDLVTYKILGQEEGPHYAHYDLVGGKLAVEQVYPCIVDFLSRYD